jgi:hypothetical protein
VLFLTHTKALIKAYIFRNFAILVPLLIFFFLMRMQLVEKQRLIEFAEALRSRLNYFDELENVRYFPS